MGSQKTNTLVENFKRVFQSMNL